MDVHTYCGMWNYGLPTPKTFTVSCSKPVHVLPTGQKDCAGVIVKCFKKERSSWVTWGGRRGYTGRPEGQSQRWRWTAETEVRQTERFEGAVLQALKMVEGATSKDMQASSGSWKRQGNGPSPSASRRNTAQGLLTPEWEDKK